MPKKSLMKVSSSPVTFDDSVGDVSRWRMLLWDVPSHQVFFCVDGSTFGSLEQFESSLSSMSLETFSFHVSDVKNDFSSWIYDVVGDIVLADQLREVPSLKPMLSLVSSRVRLIEKKIEKKIVEFEG